MSAVFLTVTAVWAIPAVPNVGSIVPMMAGTSRASRASSRNEVGVLRRNWRSVMAKEGSLWGDGASGEEGRLPVWAELSQLAPMCISGPSLRHNS
jgi:hypothetical protein